MKSKKRIQILLRILSKSDQIMDDIVQLNMQIYPSNPMIYKPFDKMSFLTSQHSTIEKNEFVDYRNALIAQLKESSLATMNTK